MHHTKPISSWHTSLCSLRSSLTIWGVFAYKMIHDVLEKSWTSCSLWIENTKCKTLFLCFAKRLSPSNTKKLRNLIPNVEDKILNIFITLHWSFTSMQSDRILAVTTFNHQAISYRLIHESEGKDITVVKWPLRVWLEHRTADEQFFWLESKLI